MGLSASESGTFSRVGDIIGDTTGDFSLLDLSFMSDNSALRISDVGLFLPNLANMPLKRPVKNRN